VTDIDVVVIYRDGVGISGAYKKAIDADCDCVIELHFNAFNAKATGTLTLCTTEPKDIEFATLIQEAMCAVFGRSSFSRGLSKLARGARGGQNVHSFPVGPNCLVEPFFGDVLSEEKLAIEKQRDYAAALVHAVRRWARSKELI
jgi:hypothetical protein